MRGSLLVYLAGGLVLGLILSLPETGHAQSSGIQGVEPDANSIVAQATDTIAVAFDSPITVSANTDTLRVFGSRFGRHEGTIQVSGTPADSLLFISDCPFRPGETVTVTVPRDVSSTGGVPRNPYTWQFTVRTEYGTGRFMQTASVSFGQGRQDQAVAKLGSVEIPSAPFAAEFNRPLDNADPGDLRTDVAFVNQKAEEVQVLFGPNLNRSSSVSVSVPGATTLTGGDLNDDGLPDLVTVSSFSDSLTVLSNQGGTFQEAERFSTGSRPADVAIADLDGDGAQDLAVSLFGEDEVHVYLNADDGTAAFERSAIKIPVGAAPTSLTARDIDRDGNLDILVGSAGEEQISVLENEVNGAGGFSQAATIDLGFVPASIAANDVSGGRDGRVDLIVSGQGRGEVVLFENDPANSFGFRDSTSLPSAPDGPALGTALADVNAGAASDHELDLISSYRSSNEVQVLRNSNNGYETSPSVLSTSSAPVGIAGLDVERDGSQDLAVVGPRGTTLNLFTNQGGRPGPVALTPNPPLSFGGVCVDEEGVDSVEVENVSNSEVVLRKSSIPSGFAVGDALSLPVTLRPGEARDVPIVFSPEDIREYDERLVLEANEQTQFCGRDTPPVPLPIKVEGTGQGIEGSASPQTLEFGEVIGGNASSKSFTIQNTGNDDADIQGIQGLDGTPFEVTDAPSSVSGSGEEQVTVRFAPTAPNSSFEETVQVTLESSSCDQQETVQVVLRGSSRPPRPDLVAEEVFFVDEEESSSVRVSDTLGVQCRYSNQGGTRVDNSFEWQIRRDGTSLDAGTDTGLAVGETRETSTVEVVFSEEGPTEITCEVDTDDLITEQIEDNNTAPLPLTVELPDQLPVQPNPFTPNGDCCNNVVEFRVKEFGVDQPAVEIYTLEGRLVRTLRQMEGGVLKWDGRDDGGERLPPGAYLYVVQDGGQDVASGDVVLAR
ncbi:FG-GAP-like repeat-containing protein [Salinibacter altiplanensis]|uniref:FG-GAP-like repeat-containing protein n=1 Tax=Salinibacter altiplanensis TaxID=1803181 RepID=UPI00311AA408